MENNAYAKIVDGIVVDVLMATEKETANFFLGEDCILIEDWAEIGWIYDLTTNTFACPIVEDN